MKRLIVLLAVLLSIDTPLYPVTKEYGNKSGKIKILIALEDTVFKNKLVEKMISILDDGKTYIRVVDHKEGELKPEKAVDYNAVFISNSGVGTKVRPWVVEWISEQKRKDHILLHTTQKAYWEVKIDVDSVTSASAPHATDVLAQKYTKKIRGFIEKK